MEQKVFDLIIIGAGPAGLAAAIYSSRYGLDVAVFSKEIGGLASTAHKVCNYPGFKEVSGFELMNKVYEQVNELKVPLFYEEIKEVLKKEGIFVVKTSKKESLSKKVILASGMVRKKLDIPGEKELYGKGVSYCATCDAAFFKNKEVAVIGGSDAALTAAILLSEYANKVYIIYRRGKFYRAEKPWIKIVEETPKIEVLFNEEVEEVKGVEENKVTSLKLKNRGDLKVDGIFIEVGSEPKLEFVDSLNLEKVNGFIKTDKAGRTNISGFYAAGDITNCELKQIVTAASQGATAAFSCFEELKREESK